MADICEKNRTILKVVDGSILTFEYMAKLSSKLAYSTRLMFKNNLPEGLSYLEEFQPIVYYSTDYEATYRKFENFSYEFVPNSNYLNVTLTPPIPSSVNCEYTFIKVRFKAFINDLDTLNYTLNNEGEFIGEYEGTENISSCIQGDSDSADNIDLCGYCIKKYAFMVTGYSLNVCNNSCTESFNCNSFLENHKEFKEDFIARFLFDTIRGEYGMYITTGEGTKTYINTAVYVMTIKPTKGLNFPTTKEDLKKIKVYLVMDCLNNGIEIDYDDLTIDIDSGNLIIRIPHNVINDDDNTISPCMVSKNILVTIPYSINNCFTSPATIKGSIELIDITDNSVLAYLDRFCLYVNTKCSDIIGVGKFILC